MRKLKILLFTFILSQPVNAQQTCKTYSTDEWPDSRYSVADISGDNVVTDNITGLMWKQCSEGLTGSDCATGSSTTHTWKQALEIAESSDFAGHTDWQLPNIKELSSLAAFKCIDPAINETVFPNTPSSFFCSSSPQPQGFSTDRVWGIDFFTGFREGVFRSDSCHVRLVRSVQ